MGHFIRHTCLNIESANHTDGKSKSSKPVATSSKSLYFAATVPSRDFREWSKNELSLRQNTIWDQQKVASQAPRVPPRWQPIHGNKVSHLAHVSKKLLTSQWLVKRACTVVSLTITPLLLTWWLANQNDPWDSHSDTSTRTQDFLFCLLQYQDWPVKKKEKKRINSFLHTAAFSFRKNVERKFTC